MQNEDEDVRTYTVVMNHEEQYSIWLVDREVPNGWATVGKTGPKADCLQYIEEVWTDMRPLSVRQQMEQSSADTAGRAVFHDTDATPVARP